MAVKPLLVSVPDAAIMLGVAEKTIWDWVYNRRIASVTVGRLRKIKTTEIDRFIEENTVPSKAS